MAAQADAMAAEKSRDAEARTKAFTREAFAALPVTTAAEQRRRCTFCRRTLAQGKRHDALYCSGRCRDRAYRRRLHKSALNMYELEWSLQLQSGADMPRCLGCGRTFSPETSYRLRRIDRRYCSATCRTRAWRTRKASTKNVTSTPAVTDPSDASQGRTT